MKIDLNENGQNYLNKEVKRGYLNQEELNCIIMLGTTHQLLMGVRTLHGTADGVTLWERFEKSGMITKEQMKYIKMATTYQRKFLNSFINDNLDKKSKQTLAKKFRKWEVRVADDYQIKKLEAMLSKMGEVKLSLSEFYNLLDGKLCAECKGCAKDRTECELRDFYEDHFVPPVIHQGLTEKDSRTCEYSY